MERLNRFQKLFDDRDMQKQNSRADKNRKLEDMRADISSGLPKEVQSVQSLKTFVNDQIAQNQKSQPKPQVDQKLIQDLKQEVSKQ